MEERREQSDRMVDRNLRTFARHVSLPGEPTECQKQSWRRTGVLTRRAPIQQGVCFMRNHRTLTLAGAGSALAATIAVATLLFPSPRSTVGAATIFASLRDAVNNAFRISYEDIGDDGLKVDGEVVVLYGRADGDASGAEERAAAVYFDAHVQADQDMPTLAGLDYELRGTFSPDTMWVYVRAGEIPQEFVESNPIAAIYLNMYKDGLLLHLDDFRQQVQEVDWEAFLQTMAGLEQSAPGADVPTDGDLLAQARLEAERVGEAVAEWSTASPELLNSSPIILSTDLQLNQLFGRLLTGKAGPEDFENLTTLITEAAGDVTVTPQSDGSHLLRASAFDMELFGVGPEEEALLADMTLEIAYDEDAGLLWVTLNHLGTYDGTVCFEQAEVAPDDPMFSDRQYRDDGVTQVVDLSGLLGLIQDLKP